MFSTLDRIDIVTLPGPDGRRQCVQTDHRTVAEMEQEPELSIFFALARVLNAKRLAGVGLPEPVVIYWAQEQPPDFLRMAIHAAGGKLRVGDNPELVPEEVDLASLEEVVESALSNLARAVAAEYKTSMTLEGLATVEQTLAEVVVDPEEDEVVYWSSVAKLGSLGGEVIRTANGGQWMVSDTGTLPFGLSTRFQGGAATINPLGKAIKRFRNGEGDSLVLLAKVVLSQTVRGDNFHVSNQPSRSIPGVAASRR